MSISLADYISGKQSNAPVVDESSIGEWNTRITLYCKSPKKGFEEELKKMDGVVAVFVKAKAAVEDVTPKVD